ncbi:MAG: universal stress protein [Deltaproteobacteria bacterium]|nr:universal stress protein [Deltaproteobacteria bacterium]
MRIIRSILAPVDFSEPSRSALDFALQLARRFDASLTILHVYEAPSGTDEHERVGQAARDAVEGLRTELSRADVLVQAVAAVGSPADQILDWARAHGFDLIVMGTHGRRGLGHLVLGSVAEHVVRSAPCPVVTLRG